MVEINEAYGRDFKESSIKGKMNMSIANIANNIANNEFKFRLSGTNDLWDASRMKPEVISQLTQRIADLNNKLYFRNINPSSKWINMIPVLIINSPVEYFIIIDQEKSRAFFIYIRPEEVNCY